VGEYSIKQEARTLMAKTKKYLVWLARQKEFDYSDLTKAEKSWLARELSKKYEALL